MYAITGAFGQTGLALSQALLNAGHPIRMIVRRDDAQAQHWRGLGAEVVVAELSDTAELTQAFKGAQAAYLMNPPAYFVPDLFARARSVHTSLIAAANAAQVPHIVALSSVGGQHASGTGNILTTHDFEQQLHHYLGKATVLRAANFIENWAWSLQAVLTSNTLPSMFHPLHRALPMVSAVDVGRAAASLLLEQPTTSRVVELHGPEDYAPIDAAHALSQLLGRPVQAVEDQAPAFGARMRQHGFPAVSVQGLIDMFAGFNSGLIAFEGCHETRRGNTTLHHALAAALANTQAH